MLDALHAHQVLPKVRVFLGVVYLCSPTSSAGSFTYSEVCNVLGGLLRIFVRLAFRAPKGTASLRQTLGMYKFPGLMASTSPRCAMLLKQASRRFSSSYRGKGARSDVSLRNVRSRISEHQMETDGFRSTEKALGSLGSEGFRTLLRREERFATRHLGPLTLFNLGGAIMFCVAVVRADKLGSTPSEADEAAERDGRYDLTTVKKGCAIAMALGTSAFVAWTARRLTLSRIVELRVVGGNTIQVLTRSLLGYPSLAVRHEVPFGDVGMNYQKLRKVAVVRASTHMEEAKKKLARESPLHVMVQTSGGRKRYLIEPGEVSVLDSRRLELVASDLGSTVRS